MYERYGGTFGSTYLQHSAHRAKQGKAANGQRQWTVKNQSTTFLFLFLCHIVLQRKQDGNNILCFFLGRLPLIGIEDTLTRIGDNRGMSVKKRNHFRSMLFTRSPCLVWQNRIDAPIWQLQNGRPLRTGGANHHFTQYITCWLFYCRFTGRSWEQCLNQSLCQEFKKHYSQTNVDEEN